jgi:hypothetical protein
MPRTRGSRRWPAGLAARDGNRRLDLYVHISDPELAKLVRAAGAGLQHARLHFFNVHDVWAETLLSQEARPFEVPGNIPPHAVVVGATPLGTALAVGAARRWHRHVRGRGLDAKARIVLADRDAEAACRLLAARYPAIPRVCELVPAPAPPDFVALLEASSERPTAVYGCLDDRSGNLALALEAEYDLGGRTPVFIPASAAAAELGGLIVRAGSIHAVPLPSGEDAFALLHDRLREPLARAVHEVYLESRTGAPDFGSRPGDRAWSELPEELRRQNRDHADGVADQLRAVWFEIAPLDDWDEEPTPLPPAAIEAMAELEHDRWCREKRAAGFRYGPERDDVRKISDLLIPWEALSEADQPARETTRRRPTPTCSPGRRFRRTRDRRTSTSCARSRPCSPPPATESSASRADRLSSPARAPPRRRRGPSGL